MLTLRTPITLTADPSILGIKDNFGKRLIGNYQMIASGLEPEDMLHLAAQAPEVYLAEDGMTSLVNMKNTFRNQNLKMEVVNNVLNRILVSDTYHMTYQDQVYISSMLQKMGVTDVKEFIRQVRNFKQETKNLHELIDLYWGGSEALLEMKEYQMIHNLENGKEAESKAAKAGHPYWLHQEIYNRLKTGAIYQEIRNYISDSYDSFSTVHASEMQISEQSFHAENILLNKLKNQTGITEQPLVYNRVNTYEMGDIKEVSVTDQKAVHEYIEAVLLNTISQLYAMRYFQITQKKDMWYRLEGVIYQAASNTLERFENYHSRQLISKEEQNEYEKTVRENQLREIETLQQFFKEYTENRKEYEVRSETEQIQLFYEQAEEKEGGTLWEETSKTTQPAEQVYHNEFVTEQIENVTNEQINLKEQLDYVNQQNIIKQQKLNQLEQIRQEPQTKQINKKKAREDTLRTLTEPEEVLLEYLNTETATDTRISQRREQLEQVFDRETLQIFDTLEKYQKNPELVIQSGEVTPDSEGLLLRDIALNETQDVLREQIQTEIHQNETAQIHKEYLQQQQRVEEHTENLRQMQEQNLTELEFLQRQNEKNLSEEEIRELQSINKLIRDNHKRSEYTEQRNMENELQRRLLQEQNSSRVELVHKQNETVMDEEMLEEIRNMNRSTVTNTVQQEEHETETNVIREIVNSRVNELQVQQNEDIERIISQNVRQQLGSISDQVYGKIEKRMDSERRRHGL